MNSILLNLKQFQLLDLIILIFIISVSVGIRIYRWQVLLSDEQKIPFLQLTPIYLLGKAITGFTPGNVGDPVRSIILKKTEGLPVSRSIKSIFVERVADLMVVIIFSLYVLFFFLQNRISQIWPGYLLLLLFIFIILLFSFSQRFSSLVLKWVINQFRNYPRIKRIIGPFSESFCNSTIRKRVFLAGLSLSVVAWTLDGLTFFYIFKSLGIDINFFFLLSVFTFSVIVGLVTLLPGGLGSLEGSLVFLLITTGIDKNIAITGALIGRFVTYVYPVFLGYLSFLWLRREKKIEKPVPEEQYEGESEQIQT